MLVEDIAMQCIAFAGVLCVVGRSPSVALLRGLLFATLAIIAVLVFTLPQAEGLGINSKAW